LGRALRVIVEERQEKFDELVQTVGPTPEQEAKIQAILRDQGAAGQLKPTPAQRTESFRKIMDVLTPAQRQKLREVLAR
jgi:Spy/CpxP family protein refolding chaperone